MSLRPTRRLPGMLLAALVIYFFATNSQVIWLYLVASLVAGMAVIGLVAPWLALRRLKPRVAGHTRAGFSPPLAQDRDRAFAGDRVTLLLEMGEERAPVELTDLRSADGRLIPVEFRPATSTSTAVDFAAGPRGLLRLASLRIASTWPLGIARAERVVRLDFEIPVHPRYLLPPEARRQGAREPAGVSASRGAGEEFLGLREYRSGDSQRRIHWPTSARTGVLMVVETARESSNASTYELDLGEETGPAGELAVQIAASLGAGNVATGVPLAMAVPGQTRHRHRWPEVLGALARARAGDPSPTRRGRDSVRISAGQTQVTVERGAASLVLDAGLPLEAALEALRQD